MRGLVNAMPNRCKTVFVGLCAVSVVLLGAAMLLPIWAPVDVAVPLSVVLLVLGGCAGALMLPVAAVWRRATLDTEPEGEPWTC